MNNHAFHPPRETNLRTATIRFDDNALLQKIVGEHNRYLVKLEHAFPIRLACRGNRLALSGEIESVEHVQTILLALYKYVREGGNMSNDYLDGIIRLISHQPHNTKTEHGNISFSKTKKESRHMPSPQASSLKDLNALPTLQTKKGVIAPRSPGQAIYMKELAHKELVFGIGPAGTGKTYLAVAQAVSMLLSGQVDRIILSRPAVEAGERLGFLPGDMREKIDPYLRPLYDALHDMMPGDQVTRRMGTGEIEVAPLAFMRGRTLSHAYVILDEAQNTTPQQMKMFLTRMGPQTHMAITGDLSQIDLPHGVTSGLKNAISVLENTQGISICKMDSKDVVRHPLVSRIIDAYDAAPNEQKGPSHHEKGFYKSKKS